MVEWAHNRIKLNKNSRPYEYRSIKSNLVRFGEFKRWGGIFGSPHITTTKGWHASIRWHGKGFCRIPEQHVRFEGVENLRKGCACADQLCPATRSFTHTEEPSRSMVTLQYTLYTLIDIIVYVHVQYHLYSYVTRINMNVCERIDDTVHHGVSRFGIAPATMRPQRRCIFPQGGSRGWNSKHGDAF